MKVREWSVRPVLNSKAEPSLEVCVNGLCASPPSGTSRGRREVKPWPEGGDTWKQVRLAARLAKEVLSGLEDVEPLEVEQELLERRQELGGNTVLAIVMALYKAGAKEAGLPLWKYLSQLFRLRPALPKPLENVVGGGKHGGGTDVQEFLLAPAFDGNAEDYIFTLAQAYHRVKKELERRDPRFSASLTLESAWVAYLRTEEVLELLGGIADEFDLLVGVDMAASELYNRGMYVWGKEGRRLDREGQMALVKRLARDYDLFYVEDPLWEGDVEGYLELQERLDTLIVGDDLFATDPRALVPIGGVIIKYNQRGSIIEAVEAVKRARELGMKVIVSHRSGETEDTFLTHFAVAVGADLFKAGAAGIRIVKLNELLRIGL